MYGETLILLQTALSDRDEVCHDETLGAVCMMVTFEVCPNPVPSHSLLIKKLFEATSDDRSSWLAHISGLSRLIEHRGPTNHQTPFARALLEHSRYLVVCILPVLGFRSRMAKFPHR